MRVYVDSTKMFAHLFGERRRSQIEKFMYDFKICLFPFLRVFFLYTHRFLSWKIRTHNFFRLNIEFHANEGAIIHLSKSVENKNKKRNVTLKYIIPNKMILRSVVWLKEVYSMVDKPHYFSSKYQNRSRKRIPSKKNVYIALFACAIFSDFHLFNSVCRVEKKGARKSEIDGKAKIYMKLSQIAHRTKNMHKKPYESFEYIETMLCTT